MTDSERGGESLRSGGTMTKTNLLIVSCSKSKRSDPDLLPAIARYDGPTFRLIRRFIKLHPSANLDLWILSAKYGLISSDRAIADYDQKMTEIRAKELRSVACLQLNEIVGSHSYERVLLCMGKTYLQSLEGFNLDSNTTIARGGMGQKLGELYRWLYGESSHERD
ncbi:MAG: DUF6884 domain-containing protein [Cyanobacteria bacterium P01_E01_bin.42]